MEIKLKHLSLENFKGIPSFTFGPDGKNASIFGDNRLGKTTIADGFRDLLFGKNLKGETDFARQPQDKNGSTIHHLETLEQAIITIDGTALELKKVYKETWLKRKKQLTGHTTDHWIDGVPVQKKKWDSRLRDMIDEETFKIVTLPGYFCSKNLKDKEHKTKPSWMVRREILFDLPPTKLSDEQIINSDPKLISLPEILGDRSADDHKAAVKESIKLAKKAQEKIEPGIKELLRTLPKEATNRKAIEAFINHIDAKIERAKDDSELAALRKELAEAEANLAEAEGKQSREARDANKKIEKKIDALEEKRRNLQLKKDAGLAALKSSQKVIDQNTTLMSGLRTDFTSIAAREHGYAEICPTCNQPLPEDQIEATRTKFLENQTKELTRINDEGKILKTETEALKDLITGAEKQIKILETDIEEAEKEITRLCMLKVSASIVTPTDQDRPEINKLEDRIVYLETVIQNRKTADVSDLEAERREEQKKLATLDAAETTKARITELKAEEKGLGAKIEDLESQLSLMNRFIVTKAHALEGDINSQFGFVQWKLFNILVNGDVEECCVPMVEGSTELSNSEEMNVGLDSIKTLSKHYNFWAPVWIDEAQGITAPIPIPSQTFKLIVSEDYPKMEVQYD